MALSLVTPFVLVVVMMMTSAGTLDYQTGFKLITLDYMFRVAVSALVFGVLALLIALFKDPGRSGLLALASVVIAGTVVGAYGWYWHLYKSQPPIHDVASDWVRPISLSDDLLRDRGPRALPVEDDPSVPAEASIEWARRRVSEVNAHTCPTLLPVLHHIDQTRVREVLTAQGYQVFGFAHWRVEAIYIDPFFGFKSDIEVRLDPDRTDIRSISRYQEADLGGNCARATRILQALRGA